MEKIKRSLSDILVIIQDEKNLNAKDWYILREVMLYCRETLQKIEAKQKELNELPDPEEPKEVKQKRRDKTPALEEPEEDFP